MADNNFVSVTEALDGFGGYDAVPREILEKAAARGTTVHKGCHAYGKKLWTPELKQCQSDPELKGYFESFRLWFDEYVETVIACEIELTDPVNRIKGHPDLICTLKGEPDPVGVDYKTPVTPQKTWKMQMAGYCHLARPTWPDLKRFFCLQLDRAGRIAHARVYDRQAQDVAVFIQAARVFNYIHGR